MSAQNAKDAADNWIALQRFTEADRGRKLQLVTFASDEHARFFYPRRAAAWQTQVNTYISRALRPRGLRVQRLALAPEDYHSWRAERPDTADLRRQFADQHQHLLPE